MPATTATLTQITKEVYEGDLREQLNNDVISLRRIEKTSRGVNKVGGRYVTFPLHISRNNGIGARLESEALPTAGQQGNVAAQVGLRYQYAAVQLTGQAIRLIDKDYQAFQSAMELELNGLKRDVARDLDRQVWSDGSGKIGTFTVATTSGGTTVTVDRPDLIDVGGKYDVIAAGSGSVLQAAVVVSNVVQSTGVVTIQGTFSAIHPIGAFFARAGASSVGGQREWTGLQKIIANSGSLFNIDPAVVDLWKSTINSNGGTQRAVSETMFTRMADDIRATGGKTTVVFTSQGVRRAYANLLTQQRQFVNTKEFTGGFGGIAFITDHGEIPIVVDVYGPRNSAVFLNEDEITLYRENDWEFMDMDGSKWERVPGFDAYRAMLYQYSELATGRRNTHGRIDDLTEA